MNKKAVAPIERATTNDTSTILSSIQPVSGLISKKKALEFPLAWRNEIEALPDNSLLNIGTTNPLAAAEYHRKRQQSNGRYQVAIYQPPAASTGFSIYLSTREAEIMTCLKDCNWVQSASLKGTHETRKPLSIMRAFGMIIVSCYLEGSDYYRLLGSINLNPMFQDIYTAVEVIDLLPDSETAAKIQRNRARKSFVKQLAKIDQRAALLRRPSDPKQLTLSDSDT